MLRAGPLLGHKVDPYISMWSLLCTADKYRRYLSSVSISVYEPRSWSYLVGNHLSIHREKEIHASLSSTMVGLYYSDVSFITPS